MKHKVHFIYRNRLVVDERRCLMLLVDLVRCGFIIEISQVRTSANAARCDPHIHIAVQIY